MGGPSGPTLLAQVAAWRADRKASGLKALPRGAYSCASLA
ncbi:DUF6053 domain-containing protein [Lysobacter enzymogenes]